MAPKGHTPVNEQTLGRAEFILQAGAHSFRVLFLLLGFVVVGFGVLFGLGAFRRAQKDQRNRAHKEQGSEGRKHHNTHTHTT